MPPIIVEIIVPIAAVLMTAACIPYIRRVLDPSMRPVTPFATGVAFSAGFWGSLGLAILPSWIGPALITVFWFAWWCAVIFARDCGTRYDAYQQLTAHYHGPAAARPRDEPESIDFHHAAGVVAKVRYIMSALDHVVPRTRDPR